MAQIPLTWQLTDFFSALGLGFLYGAVYFILRSLSPRRKMVRLIVDVLWASGCAVFTRAWVLTESHAAQLRWTMVLGVLAGCLVFWQAVAPSLRRFFRFIYSRLLLPVRNAAARAGHFIKRIGIGRRERHRKHWEKRQEKRQLRLQQQEEKQNQKKEKEKKGKTMAKSDEKELQKSQKVYYNNLY